MNTSWLALRWTVGDVSDRGFAALRLSVWGAWQAFGPEATYVIGVNTLTARKARARTGGLPAGIGWRECHHEEVPAFLRPHLDAHLSEGTSWIVSPLRRFAPGSTAGIARMRSLRSATRLDYERACARPAPGDPCARLRAG